MTKSKKQHQTVDTGEVQEAKKRATQKSKQKSNSQGLDDKTSCKSKQTKSNDEVLARGEKEAETEVVNLKAMRGALRIKGSGKLKPKNANQTPKRLATLMEAASKPASQGLETNLTYNKCVVSFAIRVDKGKDTKAGFDKKVISGLSFIQTYINKHAAFFAIDKSDSSRPPIWEKADLSAFQVILRQYFDIPNERAFNNVNRDGSRVIKRSAVMGISEDPQKCLDEAAGDSRHMGCTIFYKQCQVVNTIARQILLGAPNSIKEQSIQQIMDNKLVELELQLLSKQ